MVLALRVLNRRIWRYCHSVGTPDTNLLHCRSAARWPGKSFATKSIDKLISESERPENALKKTLGPVSLTALGIGAVIGSGIFTVIGTAIGGNPRDSIVD